MGVRLHASPASLTPLFHFERVMNDKLNLPLAFAVVDYHDFDSYGSLLQRLLKMVGVIACTGV